MGLIVVGTSYKYSSLQLREKMAFSKKKAKEALLLLRHKKLLSGAVVLSTCNRTEIYASSKDTEFGLEKIEEFICSYHELERGDVSPYLYKHKDSQVLEHLFCLASGVDSLILGERQIAGQVKEALLQSQEAKFTDELLDGVFEAALTFAKRVHEQTTISEGKVSVGSIAIDFIKGKLKSLYNKSILIIGVGKVTELLLKYLKKEKPKVVFISNRTFEKAKDFASLIGARAVNFNQFSQYLKEADAIITATKSPNFIIKKEEIAKARRAELLILDLALPRDVDHEVRQIKGVDLFHLEELNKVIRDNFKRKSIQAEIVKDLARAEVEELWSKFIKLEPEPALLP